jgi:hypothetical protein
MERPYVSNTLRVSKDAGSRTKAIDAASAGRRDSHLKRAPRPLNSWQTKMTPTEVVTEINRLLDHHTETEISGILSQGGIRSGDGAYLVNDKNIPIEAGEV